MAIPSHPAPAPPMRMHHRGDGGHRSGQVDNKPSLLLGKEENELVFSLLGKRCFTLATAVVQLLTSDPPHHTKWVKMCTGVACFVKDNPKRSYFIRVYDIDNTRTCVWQQELYTTFEYKISRPYFHTFEADDCMAGLSFANEQEATTFRNAVEEKLKIRQQKKQETRRRTSGQNGSTAHLGPGYGAFSSSQESSQGSGHKSQQSDIHHNNNYKEGVKVSSSKKSKKEEKGRKPRLTKGDIGLPTGFIHVQHIGWDPKTGFDLDGVNPELREFFNLAGVSEHQLKDDETRDFIYRFIDQHGGVAKAIESIRDAPTLPSSQPVVTAPITAPPPPVPPQRTQGSSGVQFNQSQPSYSTSSKMTSAPRAPPIPPPPSISSSPASVPPPPPPPPPPLDWSAPTPVDWNSPPLTLAPSSNGRPSMPVKPTPAAPPNPGNVSSSNPGNVMSSNHGNVMSSNHGNGMKNALLEQIRLGTTLKHVDAESDSLNSNRSSDGGSSSGGGRDALLNQIKKGVNLKKVETRTERPPSDAGSGGGLAAALAKALQDRTRVMQQTDESSSDSDDSDPRDEDEWDD